MMETVVPQKKMEKLLYLCVKRVHFSYAESCYGLAMRSPLGPVLANIFMTELDITMIPSLGNCLQNWKRSVDETFASVKFWWLPHYQTAFDENIQFTDEMEEDNKLAFLEVMVIRNKDDTINTKVHLKPTNTCIYIKGAVMRIEKALINDRLRVSKISWKFRIPTISNFAVIYPWKLIYFFKKWPTFSSFYCLFCL